MTTTIQISENLQTELSKRKFSDRETYEDIIWDLLEDTLELSDETKKHIEASRREVAEGKTVPLSEVKKRLGMK